MMQCSSGESSMLLVMCGKARIRLVRLSFAYQLPVAAAGPRQGGFDTFVHRFPVFLFKTSASDAQAILPAPDSRTAFVTVYSACLVDNVVRRGYTTDGRNAQIPTCIAQPRFALRRGGCEIRQARFE